MTSTTSLSFIIMPLFLNQRDDTFLMPRQVLLLCYYFPPAPLAFASRVGKLCKYLARESMWLPQVICGELPWDMLPGRDDSLLAEIPADISVTRVKSYLASNSARIIRRWHLHKPVGLVRKFFVCPDAFGDWIKAAVQTAAKKYPGGKSISAILASGPPNSVYLAGARLSKLWSKPLVIDMRDPWVQAWRKDRRWLDLWQGWQTRRLQRDAFEQASAIIANTPGNGAELQEAFPEQAHKVKVIPNGFDPEDLDWNCGPELNGIKSDPAAINLLYLGGLRGEGFEDVFFKILVCYLKERPEARQWLQVHFVGGTAQQVRELAKPWGLENNCRGYGVIPAREVGRPLAEADIYVLIVPAGSPGWVPAKLFYYLAGGKNILALIPPGSANSILATAGDVAEFVQLEDITRGREALARLVERVRQNGRKRDAPGVSDYVRVFDRREIARQVAEILNQVTGL